MLTWVLQPVEAEDTKVIGMVHAARLLTKQLMLKDKEIARLSAIKNTLHADIEEQETVFKGHFAALGAQIVACQETIARHEQHIAVLGAEILASQETQLQQEQLIRMLTDQLSEALKPQPENVVIASPLVLSTVHTQTEAEALTQTAEMSCQTGPEEQGALPKKETAAPCDQTDSARVLSPKPQAHTTEASCHLSHQRGLLTKAELSPAVPARSGVPQAKRASSQNMNKVDTAAPFSNDSHSLKIDLGILRKQFMRTTERLVDVDEARARAEDERVKAQAECSELAALAEMFRNRAELATASHEALRQKLHRMVLFKKQKCGSCCTAMIGLLPDCGEGVKDQKPA